MALDPTARESNVRDSIRKYFVDSLGGTYHLMFDKGMNTPSIQGTPSEIEKWVSINFGGMDRGTLSELFLDVYCCTRKDNGGFKLAQLTDAVMGVLSDTTHTDGMRRINLYRSYASQAWELIGAFVIQEVVETEQFEADDETKWKLLTAILRWSSKI